MSRISLLPSPRMYRSKRTDLLWRLSSSLMLRELAGLIILHHPDIVGSITLMPSYAYTMRVVPIDAHRTEVRFTLLAPYFI